MQPNTIQGDNLFDLDMLIMFTVTLTTPLQSMALAASIQTH